MEPQGNISAEAHNLGSHLSIGGASGRELALEGPGLARLQLMVDTVLGKLTAVDGASLGDGARRSA